MTCLAAHRAATFVAKLAMTSLHRVNKVIFGVYVHTAVPSALMMETVYPSETSVKMSWTTRQYSSEKLHLRNILFYLFF
jgi:hypothetical protein